MWRLGSHTQTDFISITFWLAVGLEPGKTTWWQLCVSSWKLSVSCHLACPLIWWCSLNCNSISGKRSFNLCPASGLMRNILAQGSRAWALKGKMNWVYISALPFTLLALWHWQMYKWHISPLQYHTEQFHCPKYAHTLPIHLYPPPLPQLLNTTDFLLSL